MKATGIELIFFADAAGFRRWLGKNAPTAKEVLVGFMKRGTGKRSMTWPEAVDEALCVGWIDGVRKRIDEDRYEIRFTPRRSRSTWSAVNIARMAALQAEGRLTPAGLAAFAQRMEGKPRTYSYEQSETAELGLRETKRLRANAAAAAFFRQQPSSYRRRAVWWVVSAARRATRERRMDPLLKACADGMRR
jgi:uncharacterized protein YdeI (YjbR/CyaY-like superfamily)